MYINNVVKAEQVKKEETVKPKESTDFTKRIEELAWNTVGRFPSEKLEKPKKTPEEYLKDIQIKVVQSSIDNQKKTPEINIKENIPKEIKDKVSDDKKKIPKRKEVGQRVESVRIVSPGEYELNLESLFEREEIVMALKEEGLYVVHLPSMFNKKSEKKKKK